jgi:acid phosphatase (class A)
MPQAAQAAGALDLVTDRVARNREVLGMHYPSDSRAGKKLAEATAPLLMACTSFRRLREQARREWR